MNTLYRRLFTGWNLMRFLRLVLGSWILVMSAQSQDTTLGLFSAFFVLTALLGVACYGTNGCYTGPLKNAQREHDDVDYEEIK